MKARSLKNIDLVDNKTIGSKGRSVVGIVFLTLAGSNDGTTLHFLPPQAGRRTATRAKASRRFTGIDWKRRSFEARGQSSSAFDRAVGPLTLSNPSKSPPERTRRMPRNGGRTSNRFATGSFQPDAKRKLPTKRLRQNCGRHWITLVLRENLNGLSI